MLTRAAERAAGRPEVSFRRGDAGALPFAGDADLVFSRFGCMFFEQPAAAFANLRTALLPGGRLCLLCWRGAEHNPWYRTPLHVAGQLIELPPPAPADAPGPLSLASEQRVRELLAAAGFEQVALHAHDSEMVLSSQGIDEAVDFSLHAGPLSRVLQGIDDATLARLRTALAAELEHHRVEQRVALGASTWIVSARRS
jgi:SAM-dependent methyltransferase